MEKLSINQAEQLLLSQVERNDFADRVYEFAQELCENAIKKIESKYIITDNDGCPYTDSDGVMCYDECRDDFMKAVFERLETQDW